MIFAGKTFDFFCLKKKDHLEGVPLKKVKSAFDINAQEPKAR